MKNKQLTEKFTPCTKRLPRLGKSIIILLKDGTEVRAMRTDSSFDECGYVYEDINMQDHYQKDVIGWMNK